MDVSKIKGDPTETLINLTRPFFEQGANPVFVATCCNRLFAGVTTPTRCRSCKRVPSAVAFSSLDEVDPSKVLDHTST